MSEASVGFRAPPEFDPTALAAKHLHRDQLWERIGALAVAYVGDHQPVR